MSTDKRIRWVKRWSPTCPYDKTGLRVRGGSEGFVFFCPFTECNRSWPMTKRDEVKVKEEIRTATSQPPTCQLHGQRITVIAGLDSKGCKIPSDGDVFCWDCGEKLPIRAFLVEINNYELGVYVSRRIGNRKS